MQFKFIVQGVKRAFVALKWTDANLQPLGGCFVENFACMTNLTYLVKLKKKNWKIWAAQFRKLKGAATLRQVQ